MLKQPRRHSLVEAIANTVVGYLLAVLTQLAVFPQFGLEVPLAQSLVLGGDLHRAVAGPQLHAAPGLRGLADAAGLDRCAAASPRRPR